MIENLRDWAQEIFIIDSCSTDRTVDIALRQGVNIVQRQFTNFGDQWNFALDRLPINTPWTMKLDADERLSPGLKEEIRILLEGDPKYSGYSMDRRLWFMGRPLHVLQPVLRLWRTGMCHFSDVIVNEQPIINGPVGNLKEILEHYDSQDLHNWYDKQNRFSTMEAIMRVKGDSFSTPPRLFGTVLERRMFFKKIFFHIPFRYQLQLLHELIGRGAWRDGRLGLNWAILRIWVRRTIEMKVKEMKITKIIPEIPKASPGKFDARILSSSLQKSVSEYDE